MALALFLMLTSVLPLTLNSAAAQTATSIPLTEELTAHLSVSGSESLSESLAESLSESPSHTRTEPVTYAANYQASANGLRARASRKLITLDNGDYEMANELEATVLGQAIVSLDQRSRFRYADETLVTERYSYRVGGIRSDRRSIDFDWEARTALSQEDDESWLLDIQKRVYDPLNHQLALSQQLHSDRATGYGTEYAFAVVDGDEVELQRYQLLGEEVLETPLGRLNTVKLERVRSPTSSRSTVIWLAPDWHYLVARIEQTNGSVQLKLELENAEVDGAAVVALAAAAR